MVNCISEVVKFGQPFPLYDDPSLYPYGWPLGPARYYTITRMRMVMRIDAEPTDSVIYQELTRLYNDKYTATVTDRYGVTKPNPYSLWFVQYEIPHEGAVSYTHLTLPTKRIV